MAGCVFVLLGEGGSVGVGYGGLGVDCYGGGGRSVVQFGNMSFSLFRFGFSSCFFTSNLRTECSRWRCDMMNKIPRRNTIASTE